MALIKKYNTGGSFADYVKERLAKGELPLTTKSWNPVQEALTTFDPNKSYEGEIKKTWAGQYRADTQELAGKLLSYLYTEYQQTAPKEIPITPKGGWGPINRDIGNLLGYIAKTKYNGNEDYALKSLAKMSNNAELKKVLISDTKNLLDRYVNSASNDTSGDNWQKLEEIKGIRDVLSNIDSNKDISDEDWEKAVSFTDKLGFQLSDFLISDQTLKEREEASKAKQAEQLKSDTYNLYKSAGITDENTYKTLYDYGFKKRATDLSESINNFLTSKGYNAFQDDSGKNYFIMQGDTPVNDYGLLTEDQFSEDYGKSFSIQNGVFTIHDKGQLPQGLTLPKWQDEGNLKRRLIPLSGTARPGLYDYSNSEWKDWEIYGDSNEVYEKPTLDLLGKRDYTAAITLVNPRTKEEIRAFRKEDGSYETEDGTILPKFTFSGFGTESSKIIPDPANSLYNSPQYDHLGWRSLKENNPNDSSEKFFSFRRKDIDVPELEKLLRDFEFEVKSANSQKRGLNIEPRKLETLRKRAKWFYNNGTEAQRNWASDNFSRINNILTQEDTQGNPLFKYKQGGILKAQSGASLEAAIKANRKYAKPVETESTADPTKKASGITKLDPKTALKDASALQIASTVSSGLSFVPGLGVVGGIGSTVFDAIEGAQDGWDRQDTLNVLGNIGFTVLAAAGLGGLKGLKMLKQVSKVADTAADVAKTSKKISPQIKLAEKAIAKGKKLEKSGYISDKASEALKAAERVKASAGDLSKVDPKDLKAVMDLTKLKTTWLGSKTAGIQEGVVDAAKYIQKKAPAVGKLAKVGLVGQAGWTGATGATDIVRNIVEEGSIPEGIANTDINSIRQALQLGSLGRIAYSNARNASGIKRNLVPVGEEKAHTIIKIGDKSIKVEGKISTPNAKNPKNWSSSKMNANKKEFLTELQNNKSVSAEGKNVISELLKSEDKIGKITTKFNESVVDGYKLREAPLSDSYRDIRDWKRTNNMLERGYGNSARFSYHKNFLKKSNPVVSAKPEVTPVTPTSNPATEVVKNTQKDKIKRVIKGKTLKTDLHAYRDYQKGIRLGKSGKNVAKNQLGGILKFQNSGIIPSLRAPQKVTLPEWMSKSQKLEYKSPYVSNSKFSYQSPYASKHWAQDSSLKVGTTSGAKASIQSDETGVTRKPFTVEPFTPEPYKNYSIPGESLRYLASLRANAKIAQSLYKAASEIPMLQTLKGVHLRTGINNSLLAEKQAAELRGKLGRAASSVADIDKATAYNLEGNKQALNIITQGQYTDSAANRELERAQTDLNNNIYMKNVDIANTQSQLGSNARAAIYKIGANKDTMDASNFQNYSGQVLKSVIEQPYRKAMWDVNQYAYKDPNVTNAYEHELYLKDLESTYKNLYEKEKASKSGEEFASYPDWLNSPQYKEYQRIVNEDNNLMRTVLNRPAMYQRAAQGAMYIAQKGGRLTLADRITLENVKYNHKKRLKDNELFYRQLMENNKLVQKALIKVFK